MRPIGEGKLLRHNGLPQSTARHPTYGTVRPVTDTVSVLLADNPGSMTLEGTNTWLLRGQRSSQIVVVDPGPASDEHLHRIAELGMIALVLISHRHDDHTAGIDKLVDLTGAPVCAMDRQFVRGSGTQLADGDVIDAAGVSIRVMATPGHTADSVTFLVGHAVLTADTILGRGTTMLDEQDGSLRAYLESVERLRGLGPRMVLPGHGPELPDLSTVCDDYLAHRRRRLNQIRVALSTLGDDATPHDIVGLVYSDVGPGLRRAAESSVQIQLEYLREYAQQ